MNAQNMWSKVSQALRTTMSVPVLIVRATLMTIQGGEEAVRFIDKDKKGDPMQSVKIQFRPAVCHGDTRTRKKFEKSEVNKGEEIWVSAMDFLNLKGNPYRTGAINAIKFAEIITRCGTTKSMQKSIDRILGDDSKIASKEVKKLMLSVGLSSDNLGGMGEPINKFLLGNKKSWGAFDKLVNGKLNPAPQQKNDDNEEEEVVEEIKLSPLQKIQEVADQVEALTGNAVRNDTKLNKLGAFLGDATDEELAEIETKVYALGQAIANEKSRRAELAESA